MKIALLADIHANFSALQTVTAAIDTWHADLVIVGGDLVNRGPKPTECLEFVHQRILDGPWYWLRGNHEDYVISQAQPEAPQTGPAAEVHRASRWTLEQLYSRSAPAAATTQLDLLKAMPFQLSLYDPQGDEARFVHASMTGIRDGIYPENSDKAIEERIYTDTDAAPVKSVRWIDAGYGAPGPGASDSSTRDSSEQKSSTPKVGVQKFDASYIGARNHGPQTKASPSFENQAQPRNLSLFGVGHTHRPLIRQLNGTLVVNAGSAGLPFDGDTRPSYAQLTFSKGQWQANIQRVDYDIKQAEQDFYRAGYLEGGGPLVKLVLIELRSGRSQLFNWAMRYQQRAIQGEISMRESVSQFLGSISLTISHTCFLPILTFLAHNSIILQIRPLPCEEVNRQIYLIHLCALVHRCAWQVCANNK